MFVRNIVEDLNSSKKKAISLNQSSKIKLFVLCLTKGGNDVILFSRQRDGPSPCCWHTTTSINAI